ncbi:DUF5103 domain-containing protein [Pontibacter silvestris]|uniref:DUF5103 domain-containing protein n=1 Tax=Pontibacter silvestris TaxID=2305183 RepID=A0ABW4WTQ6_9BACT|nr:DUF5103 domain-containing protein [Pontibacter silvestris]MCC9137969.1 DUF5103 domain-containing protein [Pontibacter silvestris]
MINKTFYNYLLIVLVAYGTYSCVPVEQQAQSSTGSSASNKLRYDDYIYNSSIQSVQTYVATGYNEEVLEPPVVPLSQEKPIILEFDRLNSGPQRLIVKLQHCNADWTPSGLIESQFLNNFNEFYITDVQNSVNTKVPYVHYQFEVPQVKLSGNYLLIVQEEGGNLLLTRRLLVYQNTVSVTARLSTTTGPAGRFVRQPVEFNVFYQDYPIINPSQEVKAIMRQNHRWDNAKSYKPTYVRDDQRRLEYIFFDEKDLFLGLSEFRAFDTRSIRYNAVGVVGINLEASPIEVKLEPDKNRQNNVYSQQPDINGKRIFNNREYGNGIVNADYTWVNFELITDEVPGNVFIEGALTDWQLTDAAQMLYDNDRQAYVGRMLLKQGYYNYYYTFKPASGAAADESYFEGSHFETDNTYDILIYYRPPGSRADLLIGYEEFFFNRK